MRIFISSPSDLAPERKIVLQVISRLASEFKHHFPVNPVLWEHEPLLATEHFQEGLVSPAECDIVLCMLWSRVGSPLPEDKFLRTDGTSGITGTEWEYQIAADAFARTGKPEIMFYRKQAPVQVSLDDEDTLALAQEQKRKVNEFFLEHFHNEDDNLTFKNAYWPFQGIDDLEELVYTHLSGLLRKHVTSAADDESDAPIVWHRGSPFRGLQSFDLEHADIFFGRNRARTEAFYQFQAQVDAHVPFMMVLGTSGSGKSSLVKAGLLPMLLTPGVVPQVAECRWCVFKPSDEQGDLTAGLLRALLSPACLTELAADSAGIEALALRVTANPHALETLIFSTLTGIKQRVGYRDDLHVRLVIVIDQFEELFSLPLTDDTRKAFVSLLASLVRSEHTWVLGTMRSDFYQQCESLPELVELMRGTGQLHLGPASGEEIGQMIELPARAAGLRFESDDNGISLDEVLRQSAVGEPAVLPLLSFTLEQLFERRDGSLLTYAAYTDLGGMEGAITRQADAIFARLKPGCQAELPNLLRALVTIQSDETESVAAKRCAWSAATATPERTELTQHFLDARLLVVEGEDPALFMADHDGSPEEEASSDAREDTIATLAGPLKATGEPTVRVAHEALLRNWERARTWVRENVEYLRARARLAITARSWDIEGRPPGLLLPDGPLLARGAEVAATAGELNDLEAAFIGASLAQVERERQAADFAANSAKQRRRRTWFGIAATVLGALGAGLLVNEGREAQLQLEQLASERAQQAIEIRVSSFARLSQKQTDAGDSLNGIHLGIEAANRSAANGVQQDEALAALHAAVWAQPRAWRLRSADIAFDGAGDRANADLQRLLVSGNPALVLEPEVGDLLAMTDGEAKVLAHGGAYAIVSQDRSLGVWDSHQRAPVSVFATRPGVVRDVAVSANGATSAVLGASTLEVHASVLPSPRRREFQRAGHTSLFMSEDGRQWLTSGPGGRAVLTQVVATELVQQPLRTLASTTPGQPGGRWLAPSDQRGTLRAVEFINRHRLLSVSDAGQRALWNSDTGLRLAELPPADTHPHQIRLGKSHLALGGNHHSVQIVSLDDGRHVATLFHRDPVAGFAALGSNVATLTRGGVLTLWGPDGQPIARRNPPRSGSLVGHMALTSATEDRLVLELGNRVVILDSALKPVAEFAVDAGLEGAVTFAGDTVLVRTLADSISAIDLQRGTLRYQLDLGYEVRPVRADPIRRRFATLSFGRVLEHRSLDSGEELTSVASNHEIRSVDYVGAGRFLLARGAQTSSLWAMEELNRVRTVAVPGQGAVVAMDGESGHVAIAQARSVGIVDINNQPVATHQFETDVTALAWRAGGSQLAVGLADGRVVTRDALTTGGNSHSWRLPTPADRLDWHGEGHQLLAIDRKHRLHALPLDARARAASAQHWERLTQAFRRGSDIVTASGAQAIRWQPAPDGGGVTLTAGDIQTLPGRVAAVAPDGEQMVALVYEGSGETEVFDAESRRKLGTLPLARTRIRNFVASPDGSYLGVFDADDHVQIWAFNDGRAVQRAALSVRDALLALYADRPDTVCKPRRQSLFGSSDCVLTDLPARLAFSSDGQRLLLGRDGQALFVLEAESGTVLLTRKTDAKIIGFTLDNAAVLTEGATGDLRSVALDANQKNADRATARLPLKPFKSAVTLAGGDGRLVPYRDGQRIGSALATWQPVSDIVDTSAEQGTLIARTHRGELALYDLRGQRRLARFAGTGADHRARFSNDGTYAITWDAQEMRLWPLYADGVQSVASSILAGQR